MKYRWIEDIKDFHNIAGKWDSASSTSEALLPFLSSEFIIRWWEYFGRTRQLMVFIVLDDNGEIAGGIPLYLKRAGLARGFSKVLTYIGGSAANYTEPLYAKDDTKVFKFLLDAIAARRDWDVLYLPDVRAESPLIAEVEAERPDSRLLLYAVRDHMNWAIDLSNGAGVYLRTLPSKLRRDIRSKRRHLEEKYGRLRLETVTGIKAVSDLFFKYKEFSLKAFSSRGRKSAFEDAVYADFFRDVIVGMERRGTLSAHALIAGDRIIAVSFGYRSGKTFNWILTAFDYDRRHYRPGYILIEELIAYIVRQGNIYYNWYGHERFYKSQWCNVATPLVRLYAVRRALGGFIYKYMDMAERALRSNKFVLAAARKLKKA